MTKSGHGPHTGTEPEDATASERRTALELVVDAGCDLHTHSSRTDGTDSLEALADAAAAVRLHTWGVSDHVRADTTWLPEYVAAVRSLQREGLTIRCGVEAKMLDDVGRLDLPARLPQLDYLLVADHQVPGADGPVHPAKAAEAIALGRTTASALIEQLVLATTAAVRASPMPAIVAHLFSVLPKCGLDERDVPADLVAELAAACLEVDAAVEVNEKWRCPSALTLERLQQAGVRLVAGSDAHRASDVGRFDYLYEVVDVPRPASRAAAR